MQISVAEGDSKKRKHDGSAPEVKEKKAKLDDKANGKRNAFDALKSTRPVDGKAFPIGEYTVPDAASSPWWKHFRQHKSAGPEYAQCWLPDQTLPKRDGAHPPCLQWMTYKSPGNLKNHAKADKHSETYGTILKEIDAKAPVNNRGRPGVQKYFTEAIQKQFYKQWAVWIAANNLPLSLGQSYGATQMFRTLTGDQKFTLPSRSALTDEILKQAQKLRDRMVAIFGEVEMGSITFDFWQTLAVVSMLAVTFHYYTKDYVLKRVVLGVRAMKVACKAAILALLAEFKIDTKIIGVTGDNASNIISVGRSLVENGNAMVFIGCYNHRLQLALKDAEVGTVQEAIAQAKAFVAYLHRSAQSLEKYTSLQAELRSTNPVVPVQTVATRWNTICDMLISLEDNNAPVSELLGWLDRVKKKKASVLEVMDFRQASSILDGILPALKAVRRVTKFLETEKAPTVGRTGPALKKLLKDMEAIKQKAGNSGPVAVFISKVQSGIESRLLPFPTPMLTAMLLDPAVRDVLMTDEEKKLAWEHLGVSYHVLVQMDPKAKAQPMQVDTKEVKKSKEATEKAQKARDLFGEELMAAAQPPQSVPAGMKDELAMYRALPRESLETTDTPAWWLARSDPSKADSLPKLAVLARSYLSIMPSSSSVERVFSTGGNIVTKKRTSLKATTIDALVLLHDNRELLTVFGDVGVWVAEEAVVEPAV